MSVKMIVGLPGSGKSYFTVKEVILPALLQKKRKVITNVTLNRDHLVHQLEVDEELIRIIPSEKGDFSDTFLDVEDYKDEWRNDKGQAPIIVVDEAHFSLNKQRKKEDVLQIEQFFSTHRQYGYDIYLITQDYRRIPQDILSFVDTYYILERKSEVKKNVYSYTVLNGNKTQVAQHVKQYDKYVFQCYKSHIGSNQEIEEEGGKIGVKLIWFTKPFLLLYGAVALLLYLFVFGGMTLNPFSFLNDEKPKTELKKDVDLKKVEFTNVGSEKVSNTTESLIVNEPPSALPSLSLTKEEKEKEQKQIKYLNQSHPFDGKLLQIRSWVGDVAFLSIYDKDSKVLVSSIRSDSLEKMGYQVETYSQCAMKLIYENVNFFVDCSEIKTTDKEPTEKVIDKVPLL